MQDNECPGATLGDFKLARGTSAHPGPHRRRHPQSAQFSFIVSLIAYAYFAFHGWKGHRVGRTLSGRGSFRPPMA